MTLPYERSRAVRNAEEFLLMLLDPKKTPRVPLIVRRMARGVLKHYPNQWEMEETQRKFPSMWGEVGEFFGGIAKKRAHKR